MIFVFIVCFNKYFLGATKFDGQKTLGELPLNAPPWLLACF